MTANVTKGPAMTHDELVEKVAEALRAEDEVGSEEEMRPTFYRHLAKAAITTIREALQEPTAAMFDNADGMDQYGLGIWWRSMLAASPLASTALRERE